MTQGITTTTFGYTGDGDRLWQEVAEVRTTFALDLNTALPQVLAQQSPDQSTRYLPGIGQQVGAVWQYLHTDALGSVRHITGEDGSVAGSWRYSPFGEIEATNGDGSLFGYTGEPQDPSSGLTYLRARYYHPALGRFLTPDAIVPDVLNGQAWNAYAYVYNDPINWVDPSGYAPWDGPVDRIREIAGNAWRSVKDGFGRANQWWNEEPDECECNGHPGLADFMSNIGGPFGLQVMWGFISKPAERVGVQQTQKWGKWGSWQPQIPKAVPFVGGKKLSIPKGVPLVGGKRVLLPTFRGGWHTVRETRGPINVNVFHSQRDGVYKAGLLKRTILSETKGRPVIWGLKGGISTVSIGALIDGGVQFFSDLLNDPCAFSGSDLTKRALLATLVGLPGALAGALLFTSLTAHGAAVFSAAAAGVLLSGSVGWVMGRTGIKSGLFRHFDVS
ncbi:MAG: hypothetical protein GFH25_541290n35 [Chloroflexi bacterium AL-N10]|nr:hypothetical protein [Chloroflexi bacterium AL-N1]NOK71228.1 hypothetical protein [Chloroflexi bacterium AL-N10]NOK76517.1 hypothetical protein [Chloroflexi bacterium AL-N5]NOK92244.1 hypothetical protein [Chloroflexi bacterium AL-N15]